MMSKIRITKRLCLIAAVLILGAAQTACGGDPRRYPLGNRIANAGEIVQGIRRGLKNHAETITIRFEYGSDVFPELNKAIDAWVEEALAETDDPTEGDYLRYQYGGYDYTSGYTIEGERRNYKVVITPAYYCSLDEAGEAERAAKALLKELPLRRSMADAEKIRVVYDWLCENVRYDLIHRKHTADHRRSTAYAALVQRTATCQGYCAALYRLLEGCGVDCRIVTGSAGEDELHAWVIARVEDAYYHLDPTLDAGEQDRQFFLAGTGQLTDHVLDERFLSEEFSSQYPISETDLEE